MLYADEPALRLALLSLAAATGETPVGVALCRLIFEAAAGIATDAEGEDLSDAIGAPITATRRVSALRVLGGICEDCGRCPRGATKQARRPLMT